MCSCFDAAATIAPTIEPADVPDTLWMSYPASNNAATAPTKPTPLTPPPDRTRSARFLATAATQHLR
jgi:hypothetical protein